MRLSLRDDSDAFLGSHEQWEANQQALRQAARDVLADGNLELIEVAGEAAFYGPKLDLQVRDSRGQEETIATVQLDFNQPERFDLAYMDRDGSQQRCIMIHRGTVGSMERVVASLLERYQGRLPLWLALVQAMVLPVSEAHDDAANRVIAEMRIRGLRVDVDRKGSLGGRIREARRCRASLVVVIGEPEAPAGLVHVTDGCDTSKHIISAGDLVKRMAEAHHRRGDVKWGTSLNPHARTPHPATAPHTSQFSFA